MKTPAILLIVFWTINIIFPDIIAYVIGWVCIFLGVSMLIGWGKFWSKKANGEDYVKFGNYKIYR